MKLLQILVGKMGLHIERTQPRGFVRFAKEYFKGKDIIGVEIGVYKGENAQQLLKYLKFQTLFLVDAYVGYADYTTNALIKCYNEAKKRLKPYKNYEFVIIHSKGFFKTCEIVKRKDLDFIYLDGAHDYENVRQDIENSFSLIKKGGVLAGHDINQEEVAKAIYEFAIKNELRVQIGKRNDWWIIK